MEFSRTDEQELLLENLADMMKDFPESYFHECDEQRKIPTEWWEAMVENGFAFLGIPEEYGGVPVDCVTHMMFVEEVGRLGGPVNLMPNFLRIRDMISFGTPEQLEFTLETCKKSPVAFAVGASEPQAGSDSKAITCTAERRDGKIYISGHKTFISHAKICEKMMTVTKDDDGKMSMWFVDLNAPGVTMEDVHKVGLKNSTTCEVYLDNVEVQESDIFGKEGNGLYQLMENYAYERIVLAAEALGMAECAYEDAMAYANQREQFGKPIASFQLVQQKALEMYLRIQNMKNLVYQAAWTIDQGIDDRVLPSACKYYCSREAFNVIDDAMQLMGGIGYTDDCRISRLWRDARSFRFTGGTDEIMVHVSGRGVLKQYKD